MKRLILLILLIPVTNCYSPTELIPTNIKPCYYDHWFVVINFWDINNKLIKADTICVPNSSDSLKKGE